MSANGKLDQSELMYIRGIPMGLLSGKAVAAMNRDCLKEIGLGIWPAAPHGGYRSLAVQALGVGGKNSASTISIAAVGKSTHGLGTRVDIGSMPPANDLNRFGADGKLRRAWLLAKASNYGFTREFGEADPNHFKHDGIDRNFDEPTPVPNKEAVKAVLETIGDYMPQVFRLVTSAGNQALIYQGIATQQIISENFAAALVKGYGLTIVEVNENDWFAITETRRIDLEGFYNAIGAKAPAAGASLTAAQIVDELKSRL